MQEKNIKKFLNVVVYVFTNVLSITAVVYLMLLYMLKGLDLVTANDIQTMAIGSILFLLLLYIMVMIYTKYGLEDKM
jgi:hypothetical protein